MNCPGCEAELPADAAFCGHCGQRLGGSERACERCGRANPPEMRFCLGCGNALAEAPAPRDYTPKHLADKILHSKSALEGERKQVTVLFADVKGSMDLAEAVDAEEWHAILDRFFTILADGVHRFEGTVNQYTGDGIMALFGAPIAHEDHAQRACWAALHLREELRRYANELRLERGLDFAVRMGLNSGEVVVGKIGDDLRMDYTAQGHTVGVAARMEEAAAAGSVYLSDATAELVGGYFELEDLGATRVKGMEQPIHVYELKGQGELRTRFDLSRARGLTRFVGREREMAALEDALERARAGEGGVVGVVAEAGVGKSRLCFEFVERCRARGIRVLEGHALAHTQDVPFQTILQVMRGYYGIAAQDSDSLAREKVAGRLLLIDEAFRESLPVIFDFLGIGDPDEPAPPMAPEARERRLFAMLHKLVRGSSAERMVVTLIEDLHWIDAASETFIAQWVDAVAGVPHLLVLNFRPEYRADWMGRPTHAPLAIRPLDVEAVREFVVDHLGTDASLDGLAEAIFARTAGNPFFSEEVIRSLVDSGQLEGEKGAFRLVTEVEAIEAPASVQALLAARIDRLPEREKRLLQTAAVIGRQFSEPILEAVAELPKRDLRATLDALKGAEFVYEESLFPVAEYAFVHPLTQEVALRSQLGERRREVHAAVARAVEAEAGDKLEEQAALLGHHWEEAGQPLAAARWHQRAAHWAGASRAEEARRSLERVRALLPADTREPEALALALDARRRLLNLYWQLGASLEQVDRTYHEGRELAERAGDRRTLALMEGDRAASIGIGAGGNVETLQTQQKAAVRMAQEIGDPAIEAVNRWRLGYALNATGRLEESLENSERILELAGDDASLGFELVGFSLASSAETYRRMALCWMGRVAEAEQALSHAIELEHEFARKTGFGLFVPFTELGAAFNAAITGECPDAVALAMRAVESSEKWGTAWMRCMSYAGLAHAKSLERRYDEALAAVEQAREIARECNTAADQEPERLRLVAAGRNGLGDLCGARAAAEEGIDVALRFGARGEEILCRLELARVLLAEDDLPAAEAELDRIDAGCDETGAEAFRALALLERAEVARRRGDVSDRRAVLADARRRFEAMPAPGRVAEVDTLLQE